MSRFYDVLREANRARAAAASEAPATGISVTSDAVPGKEFESPGKEFESLLDSGVAPLANPERPVAHVEPIHASPAGLRPNNVFGVVNGSLELKSPLLPHVTDGVILEHYRKLRTKLLQEKEARPFHILLVASPNPLEGKTVTAINLALSFAMLPSCKVLLVDGDLRKGSVGKVLGIEQRPGLSDLVAGSVRLMDAAVKIEELPLHVLLRGTSEVPPAELLNSPNLKNHFLEMVESFDLVVVDSPPLNLVTDAQLLAKCCDATLFVARAFSTTVKSFQKAAQELQQYRVLGTILNGGDRAHVYRRYHNYY